MSSTKFVFFGPIGKIIWLPCPLIGWDIFDFSSKTTEWNSMKLDRKLDHNVLYQVCVFGPIEKNKMAAITSDWLTHFRLLHWNCWTELNETWQEARSQHPLPSLCFSSWSEKTRWSPWPLIGWDIFDFSSETIEWNSTKLYRKQEISTSSTKFGFSGRLKKTRWLPRPLIGWNIFDFSETPKRNSTKLDRKQDLNVLYQVCVFRVDQYTKIAALVVVSKRLHIVLRCTICGPLGLLFSPSILY